MGDIVLVHNDTPRTMWKLAVIEELIRGNDGLVRAANIRTATGRPIARLVPLTYPTHKTSCMLHKDGQGHHVIYS